MSKPFDVALCEWSSSYEEESDTHLVLLHYETQELGLGIHSSLRNYFAGDMYGLIDHVCRLFDECKRDIETYKKEEAP